MPNLKSSRSEAGVAAFLTAKIKLYPGPRVDKNLSSIRQQWYEAYVSGNTKSLEKIESSEFIVLGPCGIEDRAERLANISKAVAEKRWIPNGSHAQDERVDYHSVSNDVILVYGLGRIVTPRGQAASVFFTELWKYEALGWQVVHLHYHEH